MLRRITTVLFDLDGTLTVPVLDFPALRRAIGAPPGASIIHTIQDMPQPQRAAAEAIIREAELDAAHRAQPNFGAIELVQWLHSGGFATGIITRNFREAVDVTLAALGLTFDVVITRDCAPPKPAPDPVLEALRRLGRGAPTALMVGDYVDDLTSGRHAGTLTCLVMNGPGPAAFEADLAVPYPADLHALLRAAFHGASG